MTRDPSISEQAAFYDQWNLQHRDGTFEAINPEIRRRGERVVEVVSGLALDRPRIIEAGCGTGWLTERLVRLGE